MINKKIPIGIKIVSILFYVVAVMNLIGGISLIIQQASVSQQENAPFSFSLDNTKTTIIYIFNLTWAGLSFFVGRGLWKGQKWARITAILFLTLTIVISVIQMTQGTLLLGLPIILYLAIGIYLFFDKKVKKFFE